MAVQPVQYSRGIVAAIRLTGKAPIRGGGHGQGPAPDRFENIK